MQRVERFGQESERARVQSTALREFWERLPVWCNVCMTLLHVSSALTFATPPRYSALGTAAFPLFWVVLYYRVGRKPVERPGATQVVALSATAAAIALLSWAASRLAWNPADPSSLRLPFELIAIAWAVVLFLHCLRDRGWRVVAVFFLGAGLYALMLENIGIALGYFRESGYHLYVPFTAVPLAVVAGWCTVFYPCAYIGEALAMRFPAAMRFGGLPVALGIAAIALSTDLHFDPVATVLGLWNWDERLPSFFLGVPLVNFTSWFAAVFGFAAVYVYVERRRLASAIARGL